MRPCVGIPAAALLLSGLAGLPAEAARVRRLGLGEMAGRADRVFVGRCVDRTSATDAALGIAVTTYTFAVTDPIKGVTAGRTSFRVPGTPQRPLLTGLPAFDVGEEALLLLYSPSQAGFSTPLGMDQGFFRITSPAGSPPQAVNGTGNDRLLEDIAEPITRAHGLRHDARGPVDLDRLVRLLRDLARVQR